MATATKAPAKKAVAKKASPAKKVAAKTAAPAKKRTPNAAFMKALTPSPALAAVVGSTPLPRTEVVSKLWAYIKKNGLQDQANKRNINADDKLKAVFGKAQITMFELAALIGKHLS
jgi:upstream activation factor subunit UAF30